MDWNVFVDPKEVNMTTNDGFMILKIEEVNESPWKMSLMENGFVPGTIIHVKINSILGFVTCRLRGAHFALRMDAYKSMMLKPTHY